MTGIERRADVIEAEFRVIRPSLVRQALTVAAAAYALFRRQRDSLQLALVGITGMLALYALLVPVEDWSFVAAACMAALPIFFAIKLLAFER